MSTTSKRKSTSAATPASEDKKARRLSAEPAAVSVEEQRRRAREWAENQLATAKSNSSSSSNDYLAAAAASSAAKSKKTKSSSSSSTSGSIGATKISSSSRTPKTIAPSHVDVEDDEETPDASPEHNHTISSATAVFPIITSTAAPSLSPVHVTAKEAASTRKPSSVAAAASAEETGVAARPLTSEKKVRKPRTSNASISSTSTGGSIAGRKISRVPTPPLPLDSMNASAAGPFSSSSSSSSSMAASASAAASAAAAATAAAVAFNRVADPVESSTLKYEDIRVTTIPKPVESHDRSNARGAAVSSSSSSSTSTAANVTVTGGSIIQTLLLVLRVLITVAAVAGLGYTLYVQPRMAVLVLIVALFVSSIRRLALLLFHDETGEYYFNAAKAQRNKNRKNKHV